MVDARLDAAFNSTYPPEATPFNPNEPNPVLAPTPLLDALGRKIAAIGVERRVTFIMDSILPIPELWLTVFIFGPEHEASPFPKMFAQAKCQKAETPDDADLVVFVGGDDVDPQLYGEKAHKTTKFDTTRDKDDMTLYHFCKKRGIPMFGVCRGAQFLHVMNGGKLYQDVDCHNKSHPIFDIDSRERIEKVSSVHHQMCMPNVDGGMQIVATATVANKRWKNNVECVVGKRPDIEAFFYRKTCCFGVQGHPEYGGYPRYMQWCLKKLDHYLNENQDLSYQPNEAGVNKLRLKPELLGEGKDDKIIVIPTKTTKEG